MPERAASILTPMPRIGFIQPTKGYGTYGSMPLAFITATADGDARNLAKASAPFGSRALARTPATMRNLTPGRPGSGSSICTQSRRVINAQPVQVIPPPKAPPISEAVQVEPLDHNRP